MKQIRFWLIVTASLLVAPHLYADFACVSLSVQIDSLAFQSLSPEKTVLLLFIIEFDDFMCYSCLESFLDIYTSLPAPLKAERVWGVVILNDNSKPGKKALSVKILEKKIRGFVKTHDIRFPLLIDRSYIFQPLSRDGSALVLFDRETGAVIKFVLPLSRGQKRHLSALLIHKISR